MKQATAVPFLLFSVFVYSVFPLIGTYADTQINPVLFVGLSHFFALIALTSANAVLIARGRFPKLTAVRYLTTRRGFLILAIGSGAINAASHATLFASFIYVSSASATALYEVWPAAVIIFIGRLLPRSYSRLKLREWAFVAMALAGVTLLITSANASDTDRFPSRLGIVGGLSLALLSATLMAMSCGLDVLLARRLDRLANPMVQPLISQNVVKAFSSTSAILAYLLFFRSSTALALSSPIILLAAGTGIFVIALGAVTYHIGNILAESPAVNVLWYLTPVLALLWLDLSGLAVITAGVALGAILIISANLLLTTRADPQTSYAGTLCGICLSAFFCNYIRGTNEDKYYDEIAAVIGIFAILVAFMLQRVSEKAHRVSRATIELLEAVRRSEFIKDGAKREISTRILDFVESRLVRRDDAPARPVSALHQGADHEVDSLGRALAVTCGRVVSFSEMLALIMLAGVALLITHLNRPSSFTGDFLPVVLTGVLVFLCVRVLEEGHGDLMGTVLLIYRDSGLAGREQALPADRRVPVISVVLLFGIFMIYGLMLIRKYGLPFVIQ